MFRYPSSAARAIRAALAISGVCAFAEVAYAQAPIVDGASSSARSGSYPAAAASSGQAEVYSQLQSLQEEVMRLRGLVEEQGHQLDVLKQQSLDRYMDLDRRMGGAAAAAPAAAAVSASPAAVDATAPVVNPASAAPAVASAGEQEAYKAAYAKLKGQQYTVAIQEFNGFLKAYPGSELVPNTYYWLGELHLVESPQNLGAAEQSFGKLLSAFPQHAKAPDALYKLGKVAFLQGDKPKAKKLMQRVIDEYGASGSSAPQLAKQFMDENLRK